MAKVTEYPRITKMKDNDILLVDGPDGTRTILQSDAAKELGSQVVKITKVSGESKVAVNTTGEDVELATMAGLEPVEEDVSGLKTQVTYLDKSFDAIDYKSEFTESGKLYRYSDGEFVSSDTYIATKKFRIYKDWTVDYKLDTAGTYCMIAFYNDSGLYEQSNSLNGKGSAASGTFTAPKDGYVAFSNKLSSQDSIVCTMRSPLSNFHSQASNTFDALDFAESDNAYQDIAQFLYTVSEGTKTAKGNGYVKDDGTESTVATYSKSEYIKVYKGYRVQFKGVRVYTTGCAVAFYDNNYAFDANNSLLGTGSATSDTWTAAKEGYIKISCKNTEAVSATVVLYKSDADMIMQTVGFDYMKTGVDGVVTKINNLVTGNLAVFGFMTDPHLTDSKDIPATQRGVRAMSMLSHKYPMDFICLGGDYCSTAVVSNAQILSDCVKIQDNLYDADCAVIPIAGNHEAFSSVSESMSTYVLFNQLFREVKDKKFVTVLNNKSTNGYWDDEVNSIRFVFFDDAVDVKRTGYTATERRNAIEAMLNGIPEGYECVIISHHPLIKSQATTSEFQDGGMEYSSVLAPYADKIICCISGHVHADVNDSGDGILHISTTRPYTSASGFGTIEETAFDVFVINTESKTIDVIRYGRGNDRHFTYGT